MRQKCCGKPLNYNKETDVYSCGNCRGHISGQAARASEDPKTPAPEVLDNIASFTGSARRPGETDEELRARLKSDKEFIERTPDDDNLTNTVLRRMLLDRDATLQKFEQVAAELRKAKSVPGLEARIHKLESRLSELGETL